MRGRRGPRKAVACALLTISLVTACADSPSSDTKAGRPNIVFILIDDVDELITPYWDALVETKELLGNSGRTFEHGFATSPVCCPARATLLTGNYPHNTGIFDQSAPDGGFEVFADGPEADTVATRLHAAGYTTAFLGKYLNGYERREDQPHVPPGWDEWFGLTGSLIDGFSYRANHNGKIKSYGDRPDDYQTDVLSRASVDFVRERDDDKPFLLYLWPSAPHAPIGPAPRHQDNRFADDELPRGENFNEADVSDKPLWIREGHAPMGAQLIDRLTREHRKRMGALIAVDEMVKALVQALKAEKVFDDTVFVFSSDNGYNNGAHRLTNKHVPYEESIRVPFVVKGPGVRRGTDSRFVTHLDVVPTILELAGLSRDDVDGRSLVPLLRGGDPPWRTDFLVEFHGTYGDSNSSDTRAQIEQAIAQGNTSILPPTYRALRSRESLYVEWYRGEEHDYELYDLAADPHELVNLLGTPQGAARRATEVRALQARLEALAACSGASCRRAN
jgi:arylsulfatase A-like enzyme